MRNETLSNQWNLPVLTYHRVGEPKPGMERTISITVDEFGNQLDWLKRNQFSTITACHLDEVLAGRASLPPNPVLLTFDDGYRELCEFALPALIDHGFLATVFIVTQRLGQASTWEKAAGREPLPLMSKKQICEWAGRGIDFGAHSRTHRALPEIQENELAGEIAGSGDDLSVILNRKVTSFAYPFGRQNARVRSAAEARFSLAFSCIEGLNDTRIDRMQIRRTMVRPKDSMRAFAHRLSKGTSPLSDLGNWRAQARLRSRFQGFSTWVRKGFA